MQRWLAAECHGAVPCLSTHPHVALRYAVADSSQERTERKEAAWSNAALGATIGGLCLWAACTRGKQARHRQRGVTATHKGGLQSGTSDCMPAFAACSSSVSNCIPSSASNWNNTCTFSLAFEERLMLVCSKTTQAHGRRQAQQRCTAGGLAPHATERPIVPNRCAD